MAVFIINNKDYSQNVLANGTYQVSDDDVFDTWTDLNGVEHRQVIRTKVSGSFNMLFKSLADYEEFLTDYRSAKQSDGSCNISIKVNAPSNVVKNINAFISFTPSRSRTSTWVDFIDKFTIKIAER